LKQYAHNVHAQGENHKTLRTKIPLSLNDPCYLPINEHSSRTGTVRMHAFLCNIISSNAATLQLFLNSFLSQFPSCQILSLPSFKMLVSYILSANRKLVSKLNCLHARHGCKFPCCISQLPFVSFL
jgi:hypothetical protein